MHICKLLMSNFLVLVLLSATLHSFCEEEALKPVDFYFLEKKQINKSEMREFAKSKILETNDTKVIHESLRDLFSLKSDHKQNQEIIALTEYSLKKFANDDLFQKIVKLYKATALRRLDKKNEGDQMFQLAINENWYGAFAYYKKSLEETGDFNKAAILEYDRVTNDDLYMEYKDNNLRNDDKEDYIPFFIRLKNLKLNDKNTSVLNDVYPHLEYSDKYCMSKEICKALCLGIDGQYEEALSVIDSVDRSLKSEKNGNEIKLYKNIPLYKALLLYHKGNNPGMAMIALQNFFHRNADNPVKIYISTQHIIGSLHKTDENFKQIHKVCKVLIESRYLELIKEKKLLPSSKINHIYDMYAMSLEQDGKWEEAKSFYEDLYSKSDFSDIAIANAAIRFAWILFEKENNAENAKYILNRVIENSKDNTILETSKNCLQHIDRLIRNN
jgi:hypothetical protein